MAVPASLHALLNQSIDYAGLFPPASLALEPAIENQATYVRSSDAWMLNTFVLPVQQFDAAKQFLSHFDVSHPLRVAALGPKTASAEALLDSLEDADAAIRSFSGYNLDLVAINHLEMFLPDDADTAVLNQARAICDLLTREANWSALDGAVTFFASARLRQISQCPAAHSWLDAGNQF